MEIDFSIITKKPVGYHLASQGLNMPNYLEILTFEQFIQPYLRKAKTPEAVYQNLAKALLEANQQQDSIIEYKRNVSLEVLAIATLQREALVNSKNFIQEYYL